LRIAQEELSEDQFESDRDELVKSKLEKPRTLQAVGSRWFTEVLLTRYDWRRANTEAEALQRLSRADLVAFVDGVLLSAKQRQRLSINVVGGAERDRTTNAADTAANGANIAANEVAAGAANSFATAQCGSNGVGLEEVDAEPGTNGTVGGSAKNGTSHNTVIDCGIARTGACGAEVGHAAEQNGSPWGEEIVETLLAHELPQFRMRQSTWAQARGTW
jgi:hypothetical protein